jgi:integrase
MPLLFQRPVGLENRPVPIGSIRDLLTTALAGAGITGTDGKPLIFKPHDFRRIFTTDAILNGMPPHIAQLILGHQDINTTMGYKTALGFPSQRGEILLKGGISDGRDAQEVRS